jgi:hypothetical protein
MLRVTYAECHLCQVSLMHNYTQHNDTQHNGIELLC